MFNGTRQGCPLSPLLYVLSLEPLLDTIENSADIGGVKIRGEEHKVVAYADDVLFFISNPRTTLPNLIKELKKYGELSNLKINHVKSEILSLSKEEVIVLQREFTWVEKDLKYLGVKPTPSLGNLYQENYIPLLKETKTEIKKISIQPL